MRILLIIIEMINDVFCFNSQQFKHAGLNQKLIKRDLPAPWLEPLSYLGVEQLTLGVLLQLIIISHKRIFVNWPRGFSDRLEVSHNQPALLAEVEQALFTMMQPLPKLFFWKSFKTRLFHKFSPLCGNVILNTAICVLAVYIISFVLAIAIMALIKVFS